MSEINNLSIIENIDIKLVESTTRKINEFQVIVSKNLKEGKDYGTIPGTLKPTLYKPGAEKILMLLGLQSTYEILDSTRDWKEGFFQYQVRCTLKKGETIITQGLGCCNTKEKKFKNQDAYTIDNTILKIAKKRSQVDASLTVASLSDIFTQDLEDIGIDIEESNNNKPATPRQKDYIYGYKDKKDNWVKGIIESHLITKKEVEYIGKSEKLIIEKANKVLTWWWGNKEKNIVGEREKREKKEKEKINKSEKEKASDKGKIDLLIKSNQEGK